MKVLSIVVIVMSTLGLTMGIVATVFWFLFHKKSNSNDEENDDGRVKLHNRNDMRLKLQEIPSDSRVSGFKRVLIVGNSPHALTILPLQLDKDVVVIGINRSYVKFWPNYLYFHDPEIINELVHDKIEIPETTQLVTDEYFYHRMDMLSEEDRQPIQEYVNRNNLLVVNHYDYANEFTTLQAILNAPKLVDSPTDRTLIYLAGIAMSSDQTQYAWGNEVQARSTPLDRQFSFLSSMIDNYPFLKPMIKCTNPSADKLNALTKFVELTTLYHPSINIIWYSEKKNKRLKSSVDVFNSHAKTLTQFHVNIANNIKDVESCLSSVANNIIQVYDGNIDRKDLPRSARIIKLTENEWKWNIPIGTPTLKNTEIHSDSEELLFDAISCIASGIEPKVICEDESDLERTMQKFGNIPANFVIPGTLTIEKEPRTGRDIRSYYEIFQNPDRVTKNLFKLYESQL